MKTSMGKIAYLPALKWVFNGILFLVLQQAFRAHVVFKWEHAGQKANDVEYYLHLHTTGILILLFCLGIAGFKLWLGFRAKAMMDSLMQQKEREKASRKQRDFRDLGQPKSEDGSSTGNSSVF